VTDVEHVIGGSGVRLALRETGPADATPILFWHGWAVSSAVWQVQLDGPLRRDFRLIAADLRGHGDSDVPAAGYDSADWAADVRALLAHIGAPTVLVGWS
jgi:non-heme chloroperoxidase